MKVLKKILSAVVVVSMMLSTFVVVYADNTNILNFDVMVDGMNTTKVFAGETLEIKVSVEDFAYFTGVDFAFRYDPEHIQLLSSDETELTEANNFYYSSSNTGGVANAMSEYGRGKYGITVEEAFSGYSVLAASVLAEKGAIRFAIATTQEGSAFVEKTGILTFKFKALQSTEINENIFRYATQDTDGSDFGGDELWAVENGYMFGYGFGVVIPGTNNIPEITIYEKPTLTGIAWGAEDTADEYVVSWEAPVEGCRGYELTVEKDGVPVGDVIELENDVTTYYMFNIIKTSKNGSATENYKVTLVALGGVGSDPVSAEKAVDGIPLEKPQNVVLTDDEKLTWEAVDDADKYVVIIKDAAGETVEELEVTETEAYLDEYLTVGDYDITVTAKNNLTMYIPATSDVVEYSTGSLVTGTITYYAPNPQGLIYNDNVAAVVTLKGAKTYTGKVAADGTFEIPNVDNGEYDVTITRAGGLTRTFTNKLVLEASVEKNLCAEGKSLTILLGNVDTVVSPSAIGIVDISSTIGLIGTLETDNGKYIPEADFVAVTNSVQKIDMAELMVVMKNYNKNVNSYKNTMYDFVNESSF